MIELDQSTGRLLLREHDPSDCLILYGSYARGDFNAASDVDVLRVSDAHNFRQVLDESITVHTYALDDLLLLAGQGSLFVLHLLREASPLNDPGGVMQALKSAFHQPNSYVEAARVRLRRAIRLLDIDESLFATAPREFLATASFVCRSLLYAAHADRGEFSFSLRSLAVHDEVAALLLATKNARTTFDSFRRIRRAARDYLQEEAELTTVSSLRELSALGEADAVFDGLMRRIAMRLSSDPYDAVSSVAAASKRVPSMLAVGCALE